MADDATQALIDAGLELHAGKLQLGRGRRQELTAGFARELTVEDLIAASQPGESRPPALKEIRSSHHFLARTLVDHTEQEASVICGYSPSRISVLKSDPAFAELLSYYQSLDEEEHKAATADMHKRLASLGFDSTEVLHQRLLDEPESFDNKTLLAVIEATADRTGHGKQSTINHEHSHVLSDRTIAALKAAGSAPAQVAEEDRRALLGIAAQATAALPTPAAEGDWIEGEGTCVREVSHPDAEADAGGGG